MFTEESNSGIYVERMVRVPTFTMTYEHSHKYCEIFYLKHGSCIYHIGDDMYHLTAGDLFIVAPGDFHNTNYEGLVPCERIIVYCKPSAIAADFLEAHPDLGDNLRRSGKVVLIKKGHLQVEGILARMMEENNLPDEYSYEMLSHLVLELLLSLKRNGVFVYDKVKARENYSTDIENAIKYIAQNYALPISLEDIAEKINLSPTYLSKKFKKVTGQTFKEYVNFIRIRHAVQALLTTDDSVTKIAMNCGFNSSNYFKDIFRRMYGISPRAFRKQSKSHTFNYNVGENIILTGQGNFTGIAEHGKLPITTAQGKLPGITQEETI